MKNSKYLLKLVTMSLFIVSFVILKLTIKYSNLNKRQWKVSRRRVKNQRIGWCNKLTNVAFKLQHKWHRKSPKKVMKLPIFYCVLVWVIWLRVSNWLHGNWCSQVTPPHTHTHAHTHTHRCRPLFSVAKRKKKGNKGKEERVSKQKLFKGCH